MAQVQVAGTPWDQCLSDYAYTRELDLPGWAWEFLRRKQDYQHDYRKNRAKQPAATKRVSGATLYRSERRFLAAEKWGLQLFADPTKSALEADVFWLPELLTHAVLCQCTSANDNAQDGLSLASFRGRCAVLARNDNEFISIQGPGKAANLVIESGSLLNNKCIVTFFHSGLSTASRHYETLRILNQLTSEASKTSANFDGSNCKYRDYLVALDSRLAGRSYRDTAEVLFGKDRVGDHWTEDTRGLKSRVRRAVERGLFLMNGGYRALL
jgi:hypothetical protein